MSLQRRLLASPVHAIAIVLVFNGIAFGQTERPGLITEVEQLRKSVQSLQAQVAGLNGRIDSLQAFSKRQEVIATGLVGETIVGTIERGPQWMIAEATDSAPRRRVVFVDPNMTFEAGDRVLILASPLTAR